ncbi:hypothetical protein K443DRAFT_682660, partial [Laccaria amethystina LaAM-08-1]
MNEAHKSASAAALHRSIDASVDALATYLRWCRVARALTSVNCPQNSDRAIEEIDDRILWKRNMV